MSNNSYFEKFQLGAGIPSFVETNTQYLTIGGSYSYGTNMDLSDIDVTGFCIPPKQYIFPQVIHGYDSIPVFEEWQQHHVPYKDSMYDFKVFSITKLFTLLRNGNPNIIDMMYTDRDCILYSTPIAEMIRSEREIFLSKLCVPKFRGYAYAELKNVHNKKTGQRKELVEKFGFDCYLESETEFLTNRGWLKFDNITNQDLVASVNISSNEVRFTKPIAKIDKKYTGYIYYNNSRMNRFSVTENHNLLVSPMHRNPSNNFSKKYFPDESDWKLLSVKSLFDSKRSHFHTLKTPSNNKEDYNVCDDYIRLSGLFVSEGTIRFRDKKIKDAAITQTPNGKLKFYKSADSLDYQQRRYTYNREIDGREVCETIWVFNRKLAERLYADYNHGAKNKKLPAWTLSLSKRQAKMFWDNLVLGDGTIKSNHEIYYTASKQLADDIQAMMVVAGYNCSVYGPYESDGRFGKSTSYQVYLSYDESQYGVLALSNNAKIGTKYVLKKSVKNKRVVCFETIDGTLITRNNGKIAIHGNCKNCGHVVRLLLECEQILLNHHLDLRRDKEFIKNIRQGNWTLQQVQEFFNSKEQYLIELEQRSTLRDKPDDVAIRQLLVNCLEHHYGSIDKYIGQSNDKYVNAVSEIQKIVNNL